MTKGLEAGAIGVLVALVVLAVAIGIGVALEWIDARRGRGGTIE